MGARVLEVRKCNSLGAGMGIQAVSGEGAFGLNMLELKPEIYILRPSPSASSRSWATGYRVQGSGFRASVFDALASHGAGWFRSDSPCAVTWQETQDNK